MRSTNRPSGPFNQTLYFTIEEIEGVCSDALREVGCYPPEPRQIEIDRFIEKRFKCEIGYERLPSDVLGMTIFDKSGKVIAVRVSELLEDNTVTGERRVRSTWAHEAGHCLLHAPLFIESPGQSHLPFSSTNNREGQTIMCRSDDIRPGVGKSYDGRWWEWQANRCIGALLVPIELLDICLQPHLDLSPVTKVPSLPSQNRLIAERAVSDCFNVSQAVARIRIDERFPQGRSAQLAF